MCVKIQTAETEPNQTTKCWFGLVGLGLPTQTARFAVGVKPHLWFSLSEKCSNLPNQIMNTPTRS